MAGSIHRNHNRTGTTIESIEKTFSQFPFLSLIVCITAGATGHSQIALVASPSDQELFELVSAFKDGRSLNLSKKLLDGMGTL